MAEILVFSERAPEAIELLTKGRELATAENATLSAALLGADVSGKAQEYFDYGAEKVYVGSSPFLAAFDAETFADALAQIAKASGAATVLIGSTKRGKEMTSRVAQILGCGSVTDVTGLVVRGDQLAVERYALGGNTLATETVTTPCQVLAVMPKSFEVSKHPVSGQVVPLDLKLREPRVKLVERRPKPAAKADIESAETLVVVGKGFGKKEDLAVAQEFANALKAELGCTRTLSADYHWLDEERMVGISGKKCKPRLMVSVGVSGQIQHTVGILSSKVIVAINKDKAAPIFKIADYGIVGDLFQVLPKLTDRVAPK